MRQTKYIRNIRLCNHNLELTITGISKDYRMYELRDEIPDSKITDDIVNQLKAENTSGIFKAKIRIDKEIGIKCKTIRVEGAWRIRADYKLFYRIVRWWYNCNFDPERIKPLFTEAFEHNAETCLKEFEETYKRNIFDFIGYIGDEYRYGNAFMDIIVREMESYEQKHSLPIE